MSNILRLRVLGFIAILIGMLLFFMSENPEKLSLNYSSPDNESEKPEAFIENAQFTLYDDKGFATELNSKKATFYSNSDRIDIETLNGTLTNENGEIVTLQADRGSLEPSQDSMKLYGQVLIKQTFPENKAWSIEGSEFTIDKLKGFISSSQAVTIRQDKSVIKAVGLNAWLDEKRIELLSSVRGQYVFDK